MTKVHRKAQGHTSLGFRIQGYTMLPGWVRTDTPKAMRAKGIGAAGVGAVVGTALGFHVTSGLMALITAIIGAAVVSNLTLLVLDIWTERAASRGTAAPAVDLSETEHLETGHLEPALL